ncbi:MAG: hypothetical protein WCJ13_02450 [Coriobacteriia bacterium]
MSRKKIELEDGAILPVRRGLWVAAVEKLHEAEAGIHQMVEAQDRIQYEAGWTRFVDSLEEFWTRFFDEGKSGFSDFQRWAGTQIACRKRESLLKYLAQARHQSQHGRIALDWEEGLLQVAPGFTGAIRRLQVFEDGTYEFDATPAHSSVPEPTLVHSPGRPHLPVVENKKHGGSFPPPTMYQGRPLEDQSPVGVARVGMQFYSEVLEQAFAEFGSREPASD